MEEEDDPSLIEVVRLRAESESYALSYASIIFFSPSYLSFY